jgi:hypothetical protein
VTTADEAREFLEAVKQRNIITELWNKGLKANPTVRDFPLYFKYFAKGGTEEAALQSIIDELMTPTGNATTDRKNRDAAFALIDNKDQLIAQAAGLESPEKSQPAPGTTSEAKKAADAYDASGAPIRSVSSASTAKKPVSTATTFTPSAKSTNVSPDAPGVKSAGTDVTRANSHYKVDYFDPTTPLSTQGAATKAFMLNKYLYDEPQVENPPDYVFETLARNGITTRDSIVDFWNSLYNVAKEPFKESIDVNQNVQNLLFDLTNNDVDKTTGQPKTSTSTYIHGIQGLLDIVFGHPVLPDKTKKSDAIPKLKLALGTTTSTSPVAPKAAPAPPSTKGVGGLPTWEEALSHMNSVFADPTLAQELVAYFQSPTNKLSRNHQRMLQLMSQTFPIKAASSFDQWMSAMKLLFQTSSLMTSQATNVNPGFSAPIRTPRFAKFNR